MMKNKRKSISKLFTLLLAALMMAAFMPTAVFAEEAEAITVYVTISDEGNLGTANDGSAMAWKKVVVKDLNSDGKYSYDEAMQAAHAAYNAVDNYAAQKGWVTKLWGKEGGAFLFINNGERIPYGVSTDTVNAGDYLMAAVMQDKETYGDYVAMFDKTQVTTTVGKAVSLNVSGYGGMFGGKKEAIANATVSTWNNGTLRALGTTNAAGNVAVKFSKPGTYIVTAGGAKANVINGGDDEGGLWKLIKSSRDASGKTIYGKMDYVTYESFIGYTEKDYGEGPYPYNEIKYIPLEDFDAEEWTAEKGYLLYSGMLTVEGKTTAPACIVTVKAASPEAPVPKTPKLKKAKVTVKARTFSDAKVYWSKVKGAKSYQVYRSVKKNSGYKKVATTKKRSYISKNLKTGKTYYYKVKAVAKGHKSSMSAVKAKKAVAKAPMLKLTAGKHTIRADWSKISESTGYKLYRTGTKGGKFRMVRDAKGDYNLDYTSINKKPGKKYYFKVRAYKKVGKKTYYGAYSAVKVKAAK